MFNKPMLLSCKKSKWWTHIWSYDSNGNCSSFPDRLEDAQAVYFFPDPTHMCAGQEEGIDVFDFYCLIEAKEIKDMSAHTDIYYLADEENGTVVRLQKESDTTSVGKCTFFRLYDGLFHSADLPNLCYLDPSNNHYPAVIPIYLSTTPPVVRGLRQASNAPLFREAA